MEISDATVFMEVENGNKDTDTEDDDQVLNYSPEYDFALSSGVNSLMSKQCSRSIPDFYGFESGPDPYPSIWASQDNMPDAIIGAGLDNVGNTCFLNSVLQCFMHTVPLLRGILSEPHSLNSCCDEEKGFCTLCSLRELVKSSLANRVVSPSDFTNKLSYFSSSFRKFQQEDAHEFLQCFLDRLESCHKQYISSQSGNLVQQVFGGRLVSKLKCCNCAHCSDTYEPLIDTSLGIENADDLLTALQLFTKVEKIDDPADKVTCENCKELVSVEKQLSFDKAPSVAVFHLKRFQNDGCFVQKIDKLVAFPLELDLMPFTDSGKKYDGELKYVLYAAIVHVGMTPTSGHYYCFIRLSPNVWCKFDDSRVVLVHEEFVLSQEAYILFYAKEGTSWFSSFIETQISSVNSTLWKTSPRSVLDKVDTSFVSPDFQNKFNCNSNQVSQAIGGSENKSIQKGVVTSFVSPDFQNRFNCNSNQVSQKICGSENKSIQKSVVTSFVSPDFQNRLNCNSNQVSQKICGSENKSIQKGVVKDLGRIQNKFESSASAGNLQRKSATGVLCPTHSSPFAPPRKKISPIVLKNVKISQNVAKIQNNTQSPPRSSSPEIYREDPPERGSSIPRNHLRTRERIGCKRRLENDMFDDMEMKTAYSFIKKNMHGSRAEQMLAALSVSKTEAFVNKKKSKTAVNKDDPSIRPRRPLVTHR